MKGNNTLELNHATMVEALQLWCEAKFKEPPTVVSVEQVNKQYSAGSFSVKLEAPEPKTL